MVFTFIVFIGGPQTLTPTGSAAASRFLTSFLMCERGVWFVELGSHVCTTRWCVATLQVASPFQVEVVASQLAPAYIELTTKYWTATVELPDEEQQRLNCLKRRKKILSTQLYIAVQYFVVISSTVLYMGFSQHIENRVL